MVYSIKKITTTRIMEKLLEEKNNGFKYIVLPNTVINLNKFKLLQTEDIFSKYNYLGKLIYSDKFNCVYRTIPYPIKNWEGKKLLDDLNLMEELFNNPITKITLKYTTKENHTEYLLMNLVDIFKAINISTLNKCKPLIFPKTYTLEDFIPFMDCPNGNYTIVTKK